MPARSVVDTIELPCHLPASPEMNESPRVTIAVSPLWGVACADGASTPMPIAKPAITVFHFTPRLLSFAQAFRCPHPAVGQP